MMGVVSGVASAAALAAILAVTAAGAASAWVFPAAGASLATDGGEELFEEEGTDDLDLGGDGLDDLELDEGEDLEGGFDIDEDDGGGADAGLEPRLDELEAQLENVSGQVSSAQHESEELREAMDHIENNVRQLLDIYALVTEGANPFADDDAGPMDMDIGETLDIFDTDGDDEAGEVVDTDDMMDDLDELQEEATEDPEEVEEHLEDSEEDSDEDGATTFDDLKSEYESDEPLEEMVEDEEDEPAADPAEEGIEDEEAEPDEKEATVEDEEVEEENDGTEGGDEGTEEEFEFDNDAATTADGRKPYLATFPDGYGTDVLVMEWLEYLVAQSDPRRAARAVDRYESFGWIGARAGDELRAVLAGPRFDGAGTSGALSADDHRRSLEYIARLADGTFGDPPSLLGANGPGPPRSALRSDGGDR